MKAISASIIVLAAAIMLVGSYFRGDKYNPEQGLQALGIILGLIGLVGWFVAYREK